VELSVVEQRYHAVMEVLAGGVPVTEVAERYGVSRQSVHTWIRRYQADGLVGLSDRSHRPAYQPRQLAAEVEAQLVGMRPAHPPWGPRRLLSIRRSCLATSAPFVGDRPSLTDAVRQVAH
jgi:transposase-like protein